MAAAVILIIVAIQLALPEGVSPGPKWLVPAIEAIGVPSVLLILRKTSTPHSLRIAVTLYLAFLVIASVMNAALLLNSLFVAMEESGRALLFAGFGVLIINVLSFGVIYWWVDGGGPITRELDQVNEWDFQYPQQASEMQWKPELFDYLYTAYTNIIAFSPTDTMPLSHRVKFLFMVQSGVSLVTILVTLSRAINLI